VAEEMVCPNMKLTNLESVRAALQDMQYEITVPPDIAEPARRAIDRMLEIGRESGN
jgi:quinolinate synthase